MIDPKTKRITVPVTKDIDLIRKRIKRDTGIDMTYVQVFNFLIRFYVERALAFANTQFVNKRATILPKLEGVPT